jgi:hypothetical protein
VGEGENTKPSSNQGRDAGKGKGKGLDPAAFAALEHAARLKREGSNIRFKYNQGYSNAVRRSVSIADFL